VSLPYSQWQCNGCGRDTAEVEIEERFSLGIYAGKWCDPCWKESGYRDEDASGFDPLDAGESYEEDSYLYGDVL